MKPDLVLCDLGLPGMDAFDVGRRSRADPTLSHTKCVAPGGYALPEAVDRACAAGFERLLAKPVDPGDLVGS